MRRLLRLLVQDVVIGVPDQRPEIRMEEHLIWNLEWSDRSGVFTEAVFRFQPKLIEHTQAHLLVGLAAAEAEDEQMPV